VTFALPVTASFYTRLRTQLDDGIDNRDKATNQQETRGNEKPRIGIYFRRDRGDDDGNDDTVDGNHDIGFGVCKGRQVHVNAVRGPQHRLDAPLLGPQFDVLLFRLH